MDHKLLLIKCIALLYRESQQAENVDNSAELVRKACKSVIVPEIIIGSSREREVLLGLKKTAQEMSENPLSEKYDQHTLLAQLRVNCHDEDHLYAAIESAIGNEMDADSTKLTIISLRKSINNYFMDTEVQETLTKASMAWRHDRDDIPNSRQWLAELVSKLEPYTMITDQKDPAINSSLNLADLDAAVKVIESIRAQDDGSNILQTGWQGLNRALGGGISPGEQWVVGAQEHNWKTGFSLSIFCQIALHNEAKCIRDPSKKPMLLRISFEDQMESNLKFMYKYLYENETGELLDNIDADPMEIAKYVYERFSSRGWTIQLEEVNPSMWTYKDICQLVLKYEAQGYEIRFCELDYLLKVPTTGCTQGPAGVDIRNMYERIKAFLASRRIPMMTPHQLAPDVKTKVREGSANFVKEMVGAGYYSGTRQLAQVIDGELFINIEKDSKGEAYLAVQRGKHRKISQTPLEYLYFVLKFVKGGIIPDDINKPDTTRLKVGGEMLSVTTDTSFADFGI